MAMVFTACDTKTENANNETTTDNTETTEEVKGTTYEGEKFTLVYPESFKETYKSEEMVNASSEDGAIKLDATFNDMGPTLDQLKVYAENYSGMMKSQGATVEEPNIDGNNLTIKSIKDGEVNMHFVVMKEDKIGVSGSLKYPEDKAGECEPMIKNIMSSIKFK